MESQMQNELNFFVKKSQRLDLFEADEKILLILTQKNRGLDFFLTKEIPNSFLHLLSILIDLIN